MICSNRPIRRLQLISNRSRRESKPPPPSPLMTRNGRYKVDQRKELNYDTNLEASSSLFLGSEATSADLSINDFHKLKVSDVSLDKFDDQYFGKVAEKKNKKGEGESGGAVDLSLVLLHFFPLPLRVAFLSYPYVYTPRSIRVFEAEREAIIFFRKYVTVLMKDIIQLLSSFSESVYTREKNDQKAVDGALIKAIEVVSELNNCLGTRFSLHKEWSRISLFS
ncbi:hypothetical protein Bca4012_031632 [Brassica carinata]|uniref:Uncharacterized protein n=1 Tax=Brassica oleracea var. oleracea TaxID=109376 RepID=A0A0D3BXZ0_BRAOL